MNTLKGAREFIQLIKSEIEENKSPIYKHTSLCKQTIDDSTISIVMTASNRSKQTYYTLDTIQHSQYKNIQVIVVDDSTDDSLTLERLNEYPFTIDFIEIQRVHKKWHNPCVNYNIGFKFVKGEIVIIQNAEVCHVGDVIQWIKNQSIQDDKYYVFDVAASKNYEMNERIYTSNTRTTDVYNQSELFDIWYQSESKNRSLHFLTALTRSSLSKIHGFSYDYTLGCSYDDDDFLLRIKSNGLQAICFHQTVAKCGGIHLYHVRNSANTGWDNGREDNKSIYEAKKRYFDRYGTYLEVSEDDSTFDVNYVKLATA